MVDFHTHTTCSDGQLTPIELINKAKNDGLKAIAITDHDCISAIELVKELAKAGSLGQKFHIRTNFLTVNSITRFGFFAAQFNAAIFVRSLTRYS